MRGDCVRGALLFSGGGVPGGYARGASILSGGDARGGCVRGAVLFSDGVGRDDCARGASIFSGGAARGGCARGAVLCPERRRARRLRVRHAHLIGRAALGIAQHGPADGAAVAGGRAGYSGGDAASANVHAEGTRDVDGTRDGSHARARPSLRRRRLSWRAWRQRRSTCGQTQCPSSRPRTLGTASRIVGPVPVHKEIEDYIITK